MNSYVSTSSSRSYRGLKAAERRAMRREKLVEAGVEIIGHRGYARTTVKDLCRQAGVSERYFYESFENKEELLAAVYQHVTDHLRDGFLDIMGRRDVTAEQRCMSVVNMFLEHVQDPVMARIQLSEILGIGEKMNEEYQRSMHELGEFICLAIRVAFPAIPASRFASGTIAAALAGALIQTANRWVHSRYEQKIEEIASELFALLMSAARAINGDESAPVVAG